MNEMKMKCCMCVPHRAWVCVCVCARASSIHCLVRVKAMCVCMRNRSRILFCICEKVARRGFNVFRGITFVLLDSPIAFNKPLRTCLVQKTMDAWSKVDLLNPDARFRRLGNS